MRAVDACGCQGAASKYPSVCLTDIDAESQNSSASSQVSCPFFSLAAAAAAVLCCIHSHTLRWAGQDSCC